MRRERAVHPMVRATSLPNSSRERGGGGRERARGKKEAIPITGYLMWCPERERGRGCGPAGQGGRAEPGSVAPCYGKEASAGTESV